MTEVECMNLHNEIDQKKQSIWALFLLNLPLALAIINSSLSYDTTNLYLAFNVTSNFHKSIIFLALIVPLIILFYSWYRYKYIENNLSEIKKRLNDKTKAFDVISKQLKNLNSSGNLLFFLNIFTILLYVVQFYILFLFK
jgi:hypothetical protein